MSENEINWEPQSVADIATALSRIGDNFRSSIAQIYTSFNQLGLEQRWVGKNYNIIVNNMMNTSVPAFESWSNYLQTTIPQTVYQIAQQQAEAGGGSVSYSLTQNSDEIKYIDETVEKSDGSQILEPDAVRSEINNTLPGQCEEALSTLQFYYSQFEELGTLNGNSAMLTIYNELDSILNKCKNVLQSFQEETQGAVEKSVQKTELTNQEAVELANRLSSTLNI